MSRLPRRLKQGQLPQPETPTDLAPVRLGPDIEPLFVTISQAAALLSMSTRFVERCVRSGELPVVRMGRSVRIDRTVLETLARAGDLSGR